MATGTVRTLLRLEGAAALVASAWLYLTLGGEPWLLVPLVLLVDVSMVGYLASPRVGAITYNALHNWVPGVVCVAIGLATGAVSLALAGAVLAAHVGMDRLFGYGLKYPTSFQETHLGRIGRAREGR